VRAVHRATAELRRGTPVLLTGETSLVVLPAETASAQFGGGAVHRTHRPYPWLGEPLGTGRDVSGVRGRAAV
jgi:hypothetical protein